MLRSEPHDIQFLIMSEVLEKVRAKNCETAAKLIRKGQFLNPDAIIIRHHADRGRHHICHSHRARPNSSIREVGGIWSRPAFSTESASKAPFYEIEDVTKISPVLWEDQERFAQRMPACGTEWDNGATEEDMPAMKQAKIYGIDITGLWPSSSWPDNRLDGAVSMWTLHTQAETSGNNRHDWNWDRARMINRILQKR